MGRGCCGSPAACGRLAAEPRHLPEEEIPARHEAIDEAARRAGRDPADIVRALNVGGGGDRLDPERAADLAGRLRFDALIASLPDEDPLSDIATLGETAAALRS